MLKDIIIKNFKSYSEQQLALAPLTLMIGANASGKSNALEAFRFLSWLSQGQKLTVLKHRVDDSEQVLRGQLKDLGYLDSSEFTLGCKTDDSDWNDFQVSICIREQELHISQEQIQGKASTVPLYQIKQAATGLNSDVLVAYNNFSSGQHKPTITCTDQISILNQLETPAVFAHRKSQDEIPKTVKRFQHLLENTLFLDPVPSLMRGDSFAEKKLMGDCSNLSGVLFTLWKDEALQPIIIDFIKSLPEQDVTGIEFFEDRRGKISLELIETFGITARKWSVELLSDGTLRVLAIAAALLSAPEGATVVIEEVDNGVHPSRAKQLLRTMREQATKRNIRLLLSTHNPALMDALPDEALADVVFCYRDPIKGDSRLLRLADLQDYAGLVSQGPLGELVTNGIIDRFIKSPVTSEQKKKNALDWIDKMQGGTSE
ncbi:AAA family ATPase [Alkalimarinus alittae]|uniref:AAA family ATPase n=1 Tax=Alkalimarinus alittae TaxID=2961619 RepID=A0ABY6N684_9ALTE|nr:ATP-binding protein [Alkalimarinus alittae]UZE97628.1 AAA family ATPase [Alkalimarinus alittae]